MLREMSRTLDIRLWISRPANYHSRISSSLRVGLDDDPVAEFNFHRLCLVHQLLKIGQLNANCGFRIVVKRGFNELKI